MAPSSVLIGLLLRALKNFVYHLDGVSGSFPPFTQVYQIALTDGIHFMHQANLMATLPRISLVDTQCINP
jgi:hypothetical protein